MLFFWKVQRHQKWFSFCQIHIHKYTNTAYDKVPEIPSIYAIFLKRQGSKDIKDCHIHKYTNTNSQIHKYIIWQGARSTHMLYFWTAGDSKIVKMIIPSVPSVPIRDPNRDWFDPGHIYTVDDRLLHCTPIFIYTYFYFYRTHISWSDLWVELHVCMWVRVSESK